MPPKFRRDDGPSSGQPEQQMLLESASDDDDFFLRGPSRPSINSTGRVHRLQNQVDEVVDIMQNNIGKVMEHGDKLEDLHDKSESLTANASAFRIKSRNLQQQMWWKECRMRILLAVIVVVILTIIIVPIIVQQMKKS